MRIVVAGEVVRDATGNWAMLVPLPIWENVGGRDLGVTTWPEGGMGCWIKENYR